MVEHLAVNEDEAQFDSERHSQFYLCEVLLGCMCRLGRYGVGSNPTTETNFGDSSGLRVTLARLLSTRVRFPGSPPNDADIAQLAEAVGSNPTQCQFKSDYPYQM